MVGKVNECSAGSITANALLPCNHVFMSHKASIDYILKAKVALDPKAGDDSSNAPVTSVMEVEPEIVKEEPTEIRSSTRSETNVIIYSVARCRHP